MVDYAFVWCGVFRRSFLIESGANFGKGLHTAEDRIFTWHCHLAPGSFACISENGYLYRKESDTSLTGVGDLRQLDFLNCIAQTLELLAAHGVSEPIWRKAYRQALALIVFHFDRRERFSPEVWYEYRRGTMDLLESLDQERLQIVCNDFGARRVSIIKGLREGSIPIA